MTPERLEEIRRELLETEDVPDAEAREGLRAMWALKYGEDLIDYILKQIRK